MVKNKIVNDPVHGFISLDKPLLFEILEHPWIQRLRRIRQLGLTHLVYPGAQHTRFQHVLGAMHLMSLAVSTLRSKGHSISELECEAVLAAILMHDIGHGPFSHVLENTIVDGVSHEDLSAILMARINEELGGALNLAIDIFNDRYEKRYLHQLVSGQLDMDRLDYLKRDSFFSGVSEGVIGSDRIIKMLNMHNDQLVVEAKGIYSIEKFLVARRLMYWQVYLHKTVLVAEKMLVQILRRAKFLAQQGEPLEAPLCLHYFLVGNIGLEQFNCSGEAIHYFTRLDDDDVMCAIKNWMHHSDFVLSRLSSDFINRHLFRIKIRKSPFSPEEIERVKERVAEGLMLSDHSLVDYFVLADSISNSAYSLDDEHINILYHNGEVRDISEASDMFDLSLLNRTVTRYYLCYPKCLGELLD
ncbi:MAG: HD domain-containing protein [Marinilabiliaceae bacterium]|nr:HD domain-containing protein [Marinilabiliaceae bacterium]